jgi:hypothetical protein
VTTPADGQGLLFVNDGTNALDLFSACPARARNGRPLQGLSLPPYRLCPGPGPGHGARRACPDPRPAALRPGSHSSTAVSPVAAARRPGSRPLLRTGPEQGPHLFVSAGAGPRGYRAHRQDFGR